ncbi:hypothetical protein [Amaricoccus sp. W119]|uniref:hypothetical protein n=1 Tax=Amaricoccus sp. W119 TaxID=3391833 RepID=UPI0039A534FC
MRSHEFFAAHEKACALCIKILLAAQSNEDLMTIISHSRAAQVAYQDLLRLHLDDTASELIGSVEERSRNGRSYLYDKFRIGTEMKSRYLGEGTPELRGSCPAGWCS